MKQKKFFFFVLFTLFFVALSSTVLAENVEPPGGGSYYKGIVYPNSWATYDGEYITGNLNSFRESDDNNIISWRALLYQVGSYRLAWWLPPIPIYSWILGVNVYVPQKGGIGADNYVALRFRYEGLGLLHVTIKYTDFTIDNYWESDTTGSYLTICYPTEDFKTIMKVEFDCNHPTSQGYLWVDLLYINYCSV